MSESLFEEVLNSRGSCNVPQLWNIICSHSTDLRAHNLVLGIPGSGDTILYQHIISRNFQPFVRRSEIISYPPNGNKLLKRAIITGIAVIDTKRNGQGGEAVIEGGGVGAAFVDIKLISEVFKGFSFMVLIVGKYFDQLLEVNEKLQNFEK